MRETLTNDHIDTPVVKEVEKVIKPLLRGWFHAVAAVGAVILTILLCWLSRGDTPRLISMLIFGLSMIELYTVSATYHIGRWPERTRRVLRSLDHANIFVLIAGTYTPLCFNILDGWLRITILSIIWFLAVLGVAFSVLTLRLPRWVGASLYIGMGWVVVLALPALPGSIALDSGCHTCTWWIALHDWSNHLCAALAQSVPAYPGLP